MQLLKISSYPARWRGLIRSASLLLILITLEGFGTLVWLLANPSEAGSKVFLAYSFERWGLILFTSFLISISFYVLWAIRSRQAWTLAVIGYFENKERAAGLLVFSTVIVILAMGVHIGLLSFTRTQAYYRPLFPLLAYMTLTIMQAWVFLLVALRQARIQMVENWSPASRGDQLFTKTMDKRLWIVLAGISLVYLLSQVHAGLRIPEAVELGDTTSYLEGAGLQLSDPAFFSERRPWGILLIYKLLGSSLAAIGLAQLAFSTVVWLTLAWTLTGSLRSSVGKITGFVSILGFSLSPTVQVWNYAGLSESFSISTLILILALFIGLLQRWKWSIFLSLIFFFALWVSIHEVNLYLGLLAATALLLFGLARRNYRVFLVLAFCIAVMLVVNLRLSSLYALPRWALPVAEVITKRILPVPEYRQYFVNQGMPVSPELMALSGRWAHSDNYAILNNPRLRPFSRWLFRDGRTVYTNFLAAHPIYLLSMPLRRIDDMLAVDFSRLIPGYQLALPSLINEFFFPIRWFRAYLAISIPLLVLVLWQHRRDTSRVFWLVVVFFTFSIPYLYLAWHGDALDLARHASIANIQFHLGLWLVFLFFLERAILNRQG